MIVNRLNNTCKNSKKQVSPKEVVANITSKLPSTLEETVKEYGAIVMKRAIKSAAELITALILYAISSISQRVLAASVAEMDIANISDQAWQKKILRCEHWLAHIVNETMVKMTDVSRAPFQGVTVKLIDGSIIKQAGKGTRGGGAVRIHMCYNLTNGHMVCCERFFFTSSIVEHS